MALQSVPTMFELRQLPLHFNTNSACICPIHLARALSCVNMNCDITQVTVPLRSIAASASAIPRTQRNRASGRVPERRTVMSVCPVWALGGEAGQGVDDGPGGAGYADSAPSTD